MQTWLKLGLQLTAMFSLLSPTSWLPGLSSLQWGSGLLLDSLLQGERCLPTPSGACSLKCQVDPNPRSPST